MSPVKTQTRQDHDFMAGSVRSVDKDFCVAKAGCASSILSNSPDLQNMNVAATNPTNRTVRLLVAIASFGGKNLEFLKKIIGNYRNMSMSVDVVVFSDAPKNLGEGVRVIVGLTSKNPWSLPFAHKPYFAQNIDRYDLFIYSEDDMAVTEKNIRAFLDITPHLEPAEVAGFLRYEEGKSGDWSFPEVHGPFCWRPDSVKQRGRHTIAEFSNEHAAFYLLTRDQLRKAIASGGFLREPYEGRYDMLCCAATDPYTNCGLRKVICISALEDFLIHHLPNRYAGQLGISLASLKEQLQTLTDIGKGIHPVSNLCATESRLERGKWSKSYYEEPRNEVLEMVPRDARTILSIGCGSGATECNLKQRGAKVTALPLDSVIGGAGARLGLEVIYGTMEECFNRLEQRNFECVLITELLHLQPDPWQVLDQCCRFVGKGGTLVISGPNFHSLRILGKRALNIGDYRKLASFEQSGIRTMAAGAIARQLAGAGWEVVATRSFDHTPPRKMVNLRRRMGRLLAGSWVLSARRSRSVN